MELIQNHETLNLAYFITTYIIAAVFVISIITRYIRKRTSKQYVSELTKLVKEKEKKVIS